MNAPSVLVAKDKTLRGLSKVEALDAGLGKDGQPVYAGLERVDVADLLASPFPTDAHFVSYHVVDKDGKPLPKSCRLRKEALDQVRAFGGVVRCSVVVIDLDLQDLFTDRKGLAWADLSPQEAEDLRTRFRDAAPDVGRPTYVYATRRGVRFVHVLSQSVPAGSNFEDLVGRVMDSYHRAGLPADRACKDWTRLFRAPRVTREDGEQTWTAAWFFPIVDRSNDDATYLVPEERDLVARDEKRAVPVRVDAERPDDEEAETMVWRLVDGKSELTEAAQRAAEVLRGSIIYPSIFNQVPLADAGARHDQLTRLVGILVGELHRAAWATPELAYALARQATKLLEQDEDWNGKAWEMTCSFWARDAAKPVTASSAVEPDLVRFPDDVFPPDIEAELRKVAEIAGDDGMRLVGPTAMTVLSGAVMSWADCGVHPKYDPCPPGILSGSVVPSGGAKNVVQRQLARPLIERDVRYSAEHKQALKRHRAEAKANEERVKKQAREYAQERHPDYPPNEKFQMDNMHREADRTPDRPKTRAFLHQNTTPEALVQDMAETVGEIAFVLDSEGSWVEIMNGRYSGKITRTTSATCGRVTACSSGAFGRRKGHHPQQAPHRGRSGDATAQGAQGRGQRGGEGPRLGRTVRLVECADHAA
jgi:hypothetical protein